MQLGLLGCTVGGVKRGLLLGLVGLAVCVPGVEARPLNGGEHRMVRVAAAYWGQADPCDATWESVPPQAPALRGFGGYTQMSPCRVWIDEVFSRDRDREETCSVVVHEYGHLLGLGHADAARFPAMRSTPPVLRACRYAFNREVCEDRGRACRRLARKWRRVGRG